MVPKILNILGTILVASIPSIILVLLAIIMGLPLWSKIVLGIAGYVVFALVIYLIASRLTWH